MYCAFDFFVVQSIILCVLLHFPHAESIIGERLLTPVTGQFPYTAAIVRINTWNSSIYFIGAGTLISKKHVLTAAQNVKNIPSQFIKVLLGSHNLHLCDSFEINSTITYDSWVNMKHIQQSSNDKFGENDIAIVTLLDSVRNITKLPDLFFKKKQTPLTGSTIVGWNTLDKSGTYLLKYWFIDILSKSECESKLSKMEKKQIVIDDSKYFCTAAYPYVLDHNNGDRGDPIIVETFLIGFFVKGYLNEPGNRIKKVNLHINMNHYIDFITDVVREERKMGDA